MQQQQLNLQLQRAQEKADQLLLDWQEADDARERLQEELTEAKAETTAAQEELRAAQAESARLKRELDTCLSAPDRRSGEVPYIVFGVLTLVQILEIYLKSASAVCALSLTLSTYV